MKKLIFIISICLIINNLSFAQVTGGGEATSKPTEVVKQKKEKGIFKHTFYITFARSKAKGDFAQSINNNIANIKNLGYGDMGGGASFNFGSLFYFNKIDLTSIGLPEGINIGLDVNYIGSSICYASDIDDFDFDPFWNAATFFNIKLGPVV
jgi:hypothetical protein